MQTRKSIRQKLKVSISCMVLLESVNLIAAIQDYSESGMLLGMLLSENTITYMRSGVRLNMLISFQTESMALSGIIKRIEVHNSWLSVGIQLDEPLNTDWLCIA
jgi:hypothetical protein